MKTPKSTGWPSVVRHVSLMLNQSTIWILRPYYHYTIQKIFLTPCTTDSSMETLCMVKTHSFVPQHTSPGPHMDQTPQKIRNRVLQIFLNTLKILDLTYSVAISIFHGTKVFSTQSLQSITMTTFLHTTPQVLIKICIT